MNEIPRWHPSLTSNFKDVTLNYYLIKESLKKEILEL